MDAEDADAALRQRLLEPSGDADASPASSSDRSPRAREMSAAERLFLSPYAKWKLHGRFPFKIALHVALLALTLLQMTLYDAQNAAYLRASQRNWAYFFLPPSQDVGVAPRFQRDLYTLNQTLDALFFLRDAYFAVADASVANYEYQRDPQFPRERVRRLDLTLVSRRRGSDRLHTAHFRVAATPAHAVGPFDRRDLRRANAQLRALESARVAFHLRDRQFGHFYAECFDWTVRVALRREQRAYFHAVVEDAALAPCASLSLLDALQSRFVWLHVVVAAVTTAYLVLSARALRRSVRVLRRASSTLPLALRLRLVNRLQLVVVVALLLQLASSCWSLLLLKAHVPISYWHRLAQGSALLLLWSALVGYLEHSRAVYSIVLTLRLGAPRVAQFLVGVSPIFMGFALFGTLYFGAKVKAFGSLAASSATLFAVLNGDVILDTFDALALQGFTVSGALYLYAFIALFVYVVLNIFIAIVEEAFFATRNCRRLLDLLLTDPQYAATNAAAQDAELSGEMARLLLQLLEDTDDTTARRRA